MNTATNGTGGGMWRRIGFAAVGAGLGWIALFSWSDLIEEPGRFLGPAFYGGLMIALIGGVMRSRRRRWYVVLLVQLGVLVLWMQYRTSDRSGLMAWVPTPAGLRNMVETLANGASAMNTYASPVSARHVDAVEYVLVLGLVVILSIDVLAGGLRRAPWAGLPVVVALSVPVSVLEANLSWVVFLGCALLFVMLLAGDEAQRVRTWARKPSGSGSADSPGPPLVNPDAIPTAAAGIGAVAAIGALLLPLLIPIGNGIVGRGEAFGPGRGLSEPVKLVNPMVDLLRDLRKNADIPLVVAATEDRDRSYLRLTVLDSFDGERWKPSKRDLPSVNRVAGGLPNPPGLDPATPGTVAGWDVTVTDDFETSWLPAPYPLESLVTQGGDWRFDSRTMDFVRVDTEEGVPIEYQLRAFHAQIDPDSLESAAPPPNGLRDSMTALPDDVSPIVEQTARRVTSAGTTDYARMVRLQDWFRSQGGFEYSLENSKEGSTTDALVHFITDEKVGYCEQFAAAMAVMARTLGVPARVVVGFLKPSKVDDSTTTYTSNALHAWPEIYFEGSGWVRFEPTPPSRTGAAPDWTQQQLLPAPIPTETPGALPIPAPQQRRPVIPDAVTPASESDGSNGLLPVMALLVVAAVALTVPALVRRRQRRRRFSLPGGTARDVVAAALWTELLATAADLGVSVPRGRSIRIVAEVLARTVVPEPADRARLDALVAQLEESRFGPPGPAPAEQVAQLTADVRQWNHLLARATPRGRRALARVLPRSILTRGDVVVPTSATAVRVGAGEIR